MTERVTYDQASAALARFREVERTSSDIDAMWTVLTDDRERIAPVRTNGSDPLDCPACGYDPMAPHNGKGDCGADRTNGSTER